MNDRLNDIDKSRARDLLTEIEREQAVHRGQIGALLHDILQCNRDISPDPFEQIRADLGPFWVAWLIVYAIMCLSSAWIAVQLISG